MTLREIPSNCGNLHNSALQRYPGVRAGLQATQQANQLICSSAWEDGELPYCSARPISSPLGRILCVGAQLLSSHTSIHFKEEAALRVFLDLSRLFDFGDAAFCRELLKLQQVVARNDAIG